MSKTTQDKVHPVAALFPMMSDEELDDLAADIKANGQRDPIVYDKDGQLIDGRNRQEACRRAGVKPAIEVLPDGVDPVAYILSKNVTRRHLNAGQKAMAVARAQIFAAKIQDGKQAAARAVGVSAARISFAVTVLQHAPELADAVLAGATSLDTAYATAKTRKQEQEQRELEALAEAEKLAKLQKDAPDLADLVTEERMTLSEAQAALTERRAKAKQAEADALRDQRVLSTNLALALATFEPGAMSIEAKAQQFLQADASLVGYSTEFSVSRIRAVIAVLSAWLAAMKGGADESEAA